MSRQPPSSHRAHTEKNRVAAAVVLWVLAVGLLVLAWICTTPAFQSVFRGDALAWLRVVAGLGLYEIAFGLMWSACIIRGSTAEGVAGFATANETKQAAVAVLIAAVIVLVCVVGTVAAVGGFPRDAYVEFLVMSLVAILTLVLGTFFLSLGLVLRRIADRTRRKN